MDIQDARYWIDILKLQPHPEGGYFKETFRSQLELTRASAPGIKQACTSIYYLLEAADYSGFHRIQSDEIWYFHKGMPLNIHVINTDGSHTVHELSDSVFGNLSVMVSARLWFAAEIPTKRSFTLVSCAVAPAFDFAEFEMADKQTLLQQYPQHDAVIERLCR